MDACDLTIAVDVQGRIWLAGFSCNTADRYDPATGEAPSGVEGPGLAVMAVSNLPCELPRESSQQAFVTLRRGLADQE